MHINNTMMKVSVNNAAKKVSMNVKHKKEEQKKSIKIFKEAKPVEKKSLNMAANGKDVKDGFINSIIDRNNKLQTRVDDMKTKDLNHLLKLEKAKKDIAKSITDFCKGNKDLFDKYKGLNLQLSEVLDGNVDYVLNNMSYKDVNIGITNIQVSIGVNGYEDLEKYYRDGYKDRMTFADYRKQLGKSYEIKSDELTDDQKGQIDTFESLKGMFKSVFEVDSEITNFKKECAEKYKKFEKEIQKVNGRYKNSDKTIDGQVKDMK